MGCLCMTTGWIAEGLMMVPCCARRVGSLRLRARRNCGASARRRGRLGVGLKKGIDAAGRIGVIIARPVPARSLLTESLAGGRWPEPASRANAVGGPERIRPQVSRHGSEQRTTRSRAWRNRTTLQDRSEPRRSDACGVRASGAKGMRGARRGRQGERLQGRMRLPLRPSGAIRARVPHARLRGVEFRPVERSSHSDLRPRGRRARAAALWV
jgi:hypothetical protein